MEEQMEKIKEFFKYIDVYFFDNYKILLDRIVETESLGYNDDKSIVIEMHSNQGVDPNIIVNDACEVLESINPLYGEMARNIARDPEQWRFNCQIREMDNLNSNNRNVELNENWNDIPILAHEFTHSFVSSPSLAGAKEQFNLLQILCEVPSIVVEYLAEDYLLDKRGINVEEMKKCRIFEIEHAQKQLSGSVPNYSSNKDIIDFIKDNSHISPFLQLALSHHYYDNIEKGMSYFLDEYNHALGTLIANYIYLKIKEDSHNIQLLEVMLTVLAKGNAYPEECIQLMEKSEIPIVRNGKLTLDEENMNILYNSYFERFKDYYSAKTK